jgi:hypothetical protein
LDTPLTPDYQARPSSDYRVMNGRTSMENDGLMMLRVVACGLAGRPQNQPMCR